MKNELLQISKSFDESINKVQSSDDLETIRVSFLGKKGLITKQFQSMGSLDPEKRREFGAEINLLKDRIAASIEEKKAFVDLQELKNKMEQDKVDVTLPPRDVAVNYKRGKVHPLTKAFDDIRKIMAILGFKEEQGPEIEDEWHNFSALNVPEHHPARDMHDTFYLANNDEGSDASSESNDDASESNKLLLRTHTSSVQIRKLNSLENKKDIDLLKIFSVGKAYRSDDLDATHSPMFHQLEGMVIGKKVTIGHMIWTLKTFMRLFFELDDVPHLRLRSSYFPFTEPSAEVDLCYSPDSKDAMITGEGGKWMEMLGCGMVHPNVLEHCGIDSRSHRGFAFGMGIERLTMLKNNISDMRSLFSNDLRWIRYYGF